MSKRVSKAASLELAFLAALDRIHADVDTSEIGEIQDWSRAVRGKFHGVAVKDASDLSKLKAGSPSALVHPNATNEPDSSSRGMSGAVLVASDNPASHGSLQYSQMAIPQLIAECASEPSEHAWIEFVRRTQPLIAAVIIKAVRRFRNVSHELVDDLTQDVYLKLCANNFRALRNYEIRQENSFFDFLKVVAANTVQDYLRTAYASKRGSAYEIEVPLEAPNASPALEREILLQEIDMIVKTLSHKPNFERDRAIFLLHYSQGLPAEKIAALPGIKLSVKGVESVLLRLTRRIRSALTQGVKKPK